MSILDVLKYWYKIDCSPCVQWVRVVVWKCKVHVHVE